MSRDLEVLPDEEEGKDWWVIYTVCNIFNDSPSVDV